MMPSVEGENLLGISIIGKSLRIVEAEKYPDQFGIRAIAEIQLDIPFSSQTVNNEDYIPLFASALNKTLDEKSIRAKKVMVALDRRMVLLKRIRVDQGTSVKELQEHIEWEVDQILLSPREDYNVGFERLGVRTDQYENILIAAIRKNIISYLKDIFIRTPLTLTTIDIDILAAVRGLLNKKQRPDVLSALIDFNEFGIDFTIIKEGKYAWSCEIESENKAIKGIEGRGEDIAKVINDELNRVRQYLDDEFLPQSYDSIYLTGDKADLEVIPHLQKLQNTADIRFADPFQSLDVYIGAEADPLIKNKPEKFLTSVGMLIN